MWPHFEEVCPRSERLGILRRCINCYVILIVSVQDLWTIVPLPKVTKISSEFRPSSRSWKRTRETDCNASLEHTSGGKIVRVAVATTVGCVFFDRRLVLPFVVVDDDGDGRELLQDKGHKLIFEDLHDRRIKLMWVWLTKNKTTNRLYGSHNMPRMPPLQFHLPQIFKKIVF